MFATRPASLSRGVLRCFGSRFASSALRPSVQTTIPFTCAMARPHVRANPESLHHTSLQLVKPFSRKLMDVEVAYPKPPKPRSFFRHLIAYMLSISDADAE